MYTNFVVETTKTTEVINITKEVLEAIANIHDGIMVCSIPHTTASLIICEDDPELRKDFVKIAENWLSPLRPFEHTKNNNPNTEAHVLSSLGGTSLIISITDGKPDLGKYQNLLFWEMDGPKKRQVNIKVIEK